MEVGDNNFQKVVLESDTPVVVDFWAPWCGPCRAIAPVLEGLAVEYGDRVTLAKVNVDENPGLAARYGIRSIPTVLFLKQAKVVGDVVGAMPKDHFKKKLDALA